MNCKNCNTILSEENRFCNQCGAKVIQHRLSFKSLLVELKENVFNLDANRPLQTFIDLFVRPEAVIGGYIQGVRKKCLNPFGYFTLAITLFGLFLFFFSEEYANAMAGVSSTIDQDASQLEITQKISEFVMKYQSFIFFLFVPLLAFISKLVFLKNKKFNYVEHLIINTYGQAHISLFSTLLYFCTVWFQDIFNYISLSVTILYILYFAYILKRLFQLSFLQIVLKTLLFFVIFLPFYLLLSVLLWVFLVVSGQVDLQEMMEAQKAKQSVSYIASSFRNWTS